MTNKGIITSDDCNEPSQEQKDLIENNDFGVMVRGDFSGMNKADLLQLDQLTFNAAYVQFDKKEQDVGSKDSFAFAYFWNKEEAEQLLAKKLIIKNQKHYMISKPRKNTTIAITPLYKTESKENINQLLGIDPQFNKEDIDTKFNQEDIARQIDPDDEYKTLVVDLTSRPKARLMKKYLSNKQEFKEQQKRVSWADHELLCNCFHIMFDNRLHNYKCNDLTFNEEVVKDAFYQKFHTNVDRVELYFKSDGVLKGDGLLFFENTLDGERTAINALNQSKEMRFVDIGYIRVSFEEKADKFGQKQERRRFFWPWMNNNKQDGAFDNVKGRSWHNHSYQQDQNQSMMQINQSFSPYSPNYQQQMQILPYMNQDTTPNYAMNQMNEQFQITSNSRQTQIIPCYLFQQQYTLLPSNQYPQQFPQQIYQQQYPQQYPQYQYPIQQQNQYGMINQLNAQQLGMINQQNEQQFQQYPVQQKNEQQFEQQNQDYQQQYGMINQQNDQSHRNISLGINEPININIININPQYEYQIQSNTAQSQHTYLPQFHGPSFNSIPSRQISPAPFSPIIQHQQQSIKIFKPELLIVQNNYEEEQINNLTQQQSQQDLINQIDNKSLKNQPLIPQKQITLIPQQNNNKTILNSNAKEFKPQFKNIQSNSSSSSSISFDQQNIEQQSSLNQQVNSQINQQEDDNFAIYQTDETIKQDKEVIHQQFIETPQEDVNNEAVPIQKDNEPNANIQQSDIPVHQQNSPPQIQQISLNSDDILPSLQNLNQIQIRIPKSSYPQQSSFQNSIDNESLYNSESESTSSESFCSSTPPPYQSSIMSDHENDSLYSYKSQSASSYYSKKSKLFDQFDLNNSPSPAISVISSPSSFTISQSFNSSNSDKSSQQYPFSPSQSQSENNNIDDNRTSSIYNDTNSQYNEVINHLQETTQVDLEDEEKRMQIDNQNLQSHIPHHIQTLPPFSQNQKRKRSLSQSHYSTSQSSQFAQSDPIAIPSPAFSETQLIKTHSNSDKSSQQQQSFSTYSYSENKQIQEDNFRIYDNNDITNQDKEVINQQFIETSQEDETHKNDLNSIEKDMLLNLIQPQQMQTSQFQGNQHHHSRSQSLLSDSSISSLDSNYSYDSYSSFSLFDSDSQSLSDFPSVSSESSYISQINNKSNKLLNNKKLDPKQKIIDKNEQKEREKTGISHNKITKKKKQFQKPKPIIRRYESVPSQNSDQNDLNSTSPFPHQS